MKIAVVGAGFWSQFQIAGWGEVPGVKVVAVCDKDSERAQLVADRFGIAALRDFESMVDAETPDLIDIITPVETHAEFVRRAAERGLPVICQKPMGTNLEEGRSMVQAAVGVPFFVNENWRFQKPIQRVKALLEEGAIGRPFRARIQFSCSFPVFDNQPFLRKLDQFILTDIGSHILDVARFLFGEASTLFCRTSQIGDIAGEDVATVLMAMDGCDAVTCEMSYASRLRDESFPQTYMVIEGSGGSIELRKDFRILVTGPNGGRDEVAMPSSYPWADPAYDLVHSSIVGCQRAIAEELRGGAPSGLRGSENLRTVELVFASYESAARAASIGLTSGSRDGGLTPKVT